MLSIGILLNGLTIGGGEAVVYNYGNYNETILKNKSYIIAKPYPGFDKGDLQKIAYDKFEKRFPVFYWSQVSDINKIVENLNLDVLLIEKAGTPADSLVFNFEKTKTIVHCVSFSNYPHGDLYTVHSDYINFISRTNFPVLPVIMEVFNTAENLREELKIPFSATVFGCHSRPDIFDIKYLLKAIEDIVSSEKYKNIFFIFLNIKPFISHTNVIFLPGTNDEKYKRKFINSCDAMCHGSVAGETFGMSCGEFALCSKPVIGSTKVRYTSHITLLGNNFLNHHDYTSCFKILTEFDKSFTFMEKDNGYAKYTPQNAMDVFATCINKVLNKTEKSALE